jgi:hypothetical protein
MDNLRLATISQNIMNSKISKDNRSGYKNIYKDIKRLGPGYWTVNITHNRAVYYKRFPYNEDGLKQAIAHREYKLKELHGEFTNFGNTTLTDSK